MDWNVVVTFRREPHRGIERLAELGEVSSTGLFNLAVMRVADVRELLERIATLPADDPFFATVAHVFPVTRKLYFATADELEREARKIALSWLPDLEGKALCVRMRRRDVKVDVYPHYFECRLGDELLARLADRGTPGRVELENPDAIVAVEVVRDQAGLALWTRADLERYPFLRASVEHRHARRPVAVRGAPSRSLLAAAAEITSRPRREHPASAAEVVELLGELEPLTLERVLATRATISEIAEAVSAIEDEDAFGEIHHEPSSPREAEVRAILEEQVFESFEERDAEREIART